MEWGFPISITELIYYITLDLQDTISTLTAEY